MNTVLSAVLAFIVFAFAAFILYITRTPTGDLSVAGVALVGAPIGAVVAYFFHSQASGQGAALSTAGVTAGIAASSGQATSVTSGSQTVKTGSAATTPLPHALEPLH